MPVPLRFAAAAFCALLICVTAIVVLSLAFSFSATAVRKVAMGQVSRLGEVAQGRITTFVQTPYLMGVSLQNQVRSGNVIRPPAWDSTGESRAMDWWLSQMTGMNAAVNWALQFTAIGFEDGNYAGTAWIDETTFIQERMEWLTSNRTARANGTSNGIHTTTFNQSNLQRVTSIAPTWELTTYDPRYRGWYRSTPRILNAAGWGQYISVYPTALVQSCQLALVNNMDEFIGVVVVVFALTQLSNFLRTLERTPHTEVILLSPAMDIVASSSTVPFLIETPVPSNYSGVVPAGCELSLAIQTGAKSVMVCQLKLQNYAGWSLAGSVAAQTRLLETGRTTSITDRIDTNDGGAFMSVIPLRSRMPNGTAVPGLDWRMVTVMPESDVMQDVTNGRNYAIIATVLLVLALTVVAVVAVAVTLRPLEELATRMEAAAALADDGPEMAPSKFSEIESIRCQYEYMRKELTQLKSFVPQALFAKEDDEESEMAEEEERRSQIGLQSVTDGRESANVQRGTTRDGTSTAKGTAYKGDAERHTVDAKSVRSSSRASKGSIHDRPGLNLVISTTVKKATLVVFNVVGFHQKLMESSQHALNIHSQALTIVEAAVKRYKGVLDYFNGDHVFLSFNAVTTAAAHQAKAVGTAREISETLKQICNCSIGVATGELITGNIGSATSKRFCSLGATFTDALALERLCKAYDVRVLCSKAVIDHCSHEFYYRNLDVVALPSLGKDAARPVATIIGSKLGGPEDEWMYEMQRASKADVGAVINDAVERYAKGDATVLQSLVSNAEELALVNDEAVRNRLRIMASMDVQRYLQSGPSGKSVAPGA